MAEPFIPEYITVHLGTPNSNAPNVTVPFPEYIKNVASSELYPTWPENALRANIYAQLSFALNRYYTEFYRSQGKDFDITSSTAFDQAFVQNREIFDNISDIVDEIFDSYLVRQGQIQPFFAQYCNGTTVTCPGLSQWGTVPLARNGLTPFEILQRYYGDDINIVTDVPVEPNANSYPGFSLSVGSVGAPVRLIQFWLNRISANYPNIPKIQTIDGIFDEVTESAVKKFQQIFNLTPDGIVGKATWYRILYIFNAVKRLSELNSEGISRQELNQQYNRPYRLGDSGKGVLSLQYYLQTISDYYPSVPSLTLDGIFGEGTERTVKAFQTLFGLNPDGIVGNQTWNQIYDAYLGVIRDRPFNPAGLRQFPGQTLRVGSTGEFVEFLQQYINAAALVYPSVPTLPVTGNYGQQTRNAVSEFQRVYGLPVTGTVGPLTWYELASIYESVERGNFRQTGQAPGYIINR